MKGIIRPEATVLDENTIVPDQNLILPPPNQFTHEIAQTSPFFFTNFQQGTPANGEFLAGKKVVLLVYDGGDYCRVADGQGLYVETEYGSLKKL